MSRCERCHLSYDRALGHPTLGPVCPVCLRPVRALKVKVEPLGPSPRWSPSVRPAPDGNHTVVVDAAYQNGWAAVAAVADGYRQLDLRVVPVPTSVAAERLALARALDAVEALGWERVVFLSDCQSVAARYEGFVRREGWRVLHARRAAVTPAHSLALAELRRWLASDMREGAT